MRELDTSITEALESYASGRPLHEMSGEYVINAIHSITDDSTEMGPMLELWLEAKIKAHKEKP
jgi:hypothetical protein